MRKCYIVAIFVFVVLSSLAVVATAGAPNKPDRPPCPQGYTEDANSTPEIVLCTRETIREVVVTMNVPGPERLVEVVREVRVEVPGPTRVVVKRVPGKTKIKRVIVTKIKTHTVFKKFCPKKPNGDLAG